jgi:hypothetical protein
MGRIMSRLHFVSSIAMLVFSVSLGCDAEESRRGGFGPTGGGGKADDADAGESSELREQHLERVGACEVRADRDRSHTSTLRIERQETIEVDRRACISAANDALVDVLETTLGTAESSLAGQVEQSFTTWRNAIDSVCVLLTDASEGGTEKGAGVTAARCAAQGELQLAELVQAFVDLGGSLADPPHDPELYAACYDAFEAATQGESADIGAAASQFAACIRSELLDEAGVELAIRIAEAYPGRDEGMVLEQVEGRFARHRSGSTDLCMVLGAAGPAAGSEAAALEFRRCEVAAALWMGRLIGDIVPEALPDPMPE